MDGESGVSDYSPGAGTSGREETPNALDLSAAVEEACGSPPVYSPEFILITEDGELLQGAEAARKLRERGPNPILNAVADRLADGGVRIAYERIATAERFGEPWPAPAASVCDLDSELRVIERRDYGGFIRH